MIITINDYKYTTSNPVYQLDYGQKLNIYGIDSTDEVIQVHFTDNSCERTIVILVSKYTGYYQVSIAIVVRKTEVLNFMMIIFLTCK